METQIICGKNPVNEALENGHPIDKIFIAKGSEKSLSGIAAKAKDRGIPVYFSDKEKIAQLAQTEQHQGVAAQVSEYEYASIDDLLQVAKEKGEPPFIVILDGIEDPHNLGAIIRSADGAGVHGIIIPKRRAVSVNGTVAKVSAGAVEYVKVARVPNLVQAMEKLKKEGLWIGAVDMSNQLYYQSDLKGSIGLVIGGEGGGISKLVKNNCDFILSIPMKGGVSSLNASNAAAVMMFEVCRQRMI